MSNGKKSRAARPGPGRSFDPTPPDQQAGADRWKLTSISKALGWYGSPVGIHLEDWCISPNGGGRWAVHIIDQQVSSFATQNEAMRWVEAGVSVE